jgi:hypothetical protein
VDVVDLTGPLGTTQFAFLSQKAVHHLAPNTEDFLGVVVEDGVLPPAYALGKKNPTGFTEVSV